MRRHRLAKDQDIEQKFDSVQVNHDQTTYEIVKNNQSVDINISQNNNITLQEYTAGLGPLGEALTQANSKSISGYSNLPLEGTFDRSQLFSQGHTRPK